MKLTDFLQDVGRPIAYYPKLRRITGSTGATILLCQFIYWRGKEGGQDGWLYKTSGDIEEETGLSYEEQKTARRHLVDNGLMEEHYARLDHQMKFRLLLDAIDGKWGQPKCHVPESGNATLGKATTPSSLYVTETTPENTTSPIGEYIRLFALTPSPMDQMTLDDLQAKYPSDRIVACIQEIHKRGVNSIKYAAKMLAGGWPDNKQFGGVSPEFEDARLAALSEAING